MEAPLLPEGSPLAHPSETSEPEPEPELLNGGTPLTPEQAVHRATEELHATARAAGLAALRVEWEMTDTPDPAQLAMQSRVTSLFADLETGGMGPFPDALSELRPPPEPDAFLVEGLIRPGTTVMLTGPPGTSKSWISRQLAIACGSGLRLFLDRYPIPRRLRVLVVDEDNGAAEEWRRDEVLLAAMGIARTQLNDHVQRICLEGVQLDQERWQHWLRGWIRMGKYDLVILDPISEMHGGKELREDPAFRSLLMFLKRLKVDFPQLATFLVHHTRKPMSGDRGAIRSLDDVRGQWGQTPDVVALLTNLGERRARWEVHKRMPGSTLILEAPEYGPVRVVSDETTASTRTMSTDHRVIGAIQAGAEDWEQIQHATGMSKSGIFKVIARLRRAGLVSKQAPYQMLEGD